MKQVIGFCSVLLGSCAVGCLVLESAPGETSSTGSGSSGTSSGGLAGRLIQEWTATAPTEPALEYVLPSWLHMACNSTNRTSQWGPSLMRRPYGPNAARPRNVGLGWGLSVENRRRNHVHDSDSWDGPSWNDPTPITAMVKTGAQLDPAGTNTATRFMTAPNQRSQIAPVPDGFASGWFKGNASKLPIAYFAVGDPAQIWKFKTIADITEWTRLYAGVGKGGLFIDTAGSDPSGAPSIDGTSELFAFAAQHETDGNGAIALYPSSYIPTDSTDVTRDPDELWSDAGLTLLPNGYFHVVMRVALNYASTEGSSTYHHLLFGNLSNQLRIDLKQNKIVLEGSGSILAGPNSGTLEWIRETELTIEAKVTPTGRYLKVSGAYGGNFEVSDSTDRPWPVLEKFSILGDSSGAQECADLRYIGFYEPN
ncbi:MAG TPA: hypothetical protein PKA58_06970 [Polyangium sp.]|nr:hypothetical protein [Polyangium sp.]